MDSNAAIVQERIVSRNADCISGFITAALKSSKEVNIRSAVMSKTISRMKHEEIPLMTRKKGRSAYLRLGLFLISARRWLIGSVIFCAGLRIKFPAKALSHEAALGIGRADLLEQSTSRSLWRMLMETLSRRTSS